MYCNAKIKKDSFHVFGNDMFFSVGCVSGFAKDNNSNLIEVTEKYISENSVKTTDEFGNAVIEIPIDVKSHVEDVQNSDGTNVEPEHFSLFPHTHYIENISKYKVNDFIPVTEWLNLLVQLKKLYVIS